MADYIDKESLLYKIGQMPIAWEYGQAVKDIYEMVKNEPDADVAPVVHGKWLDEDFPEKMATVHGFAICSVCGKLSHKAEHGYNLLSKYCPKCGALMYEKL